jgi:hypothetical protein
MTKAFGWAFKLAALTCFTAVVATWHHLHLQAFLAGVQDLVAKRLPKKLRAYKWRSRSSLLQLYFHEPHVHYEVWVQRKTGSVEIGLHFEGDREESYAWAEALAPYAGEIQGQLGPDVELEEWTQKWTRLHEQRSLPGDLSWRPKDQLTDELLEEVGERLAQFIAVLEPIVERERKNVVFAKKAPAKKASARGRAQPRGRAGGGAASRSARAPARARSRRL